MFGNRQIAAIEGKCRCFKILQNKSLCREKLINFDTKGAKRSVKMWNTNFYKSFIKIFVVNEWNAVKNFVRTYICLPGWFILTESVFSHPSR